MKTKKLISFLAGMLMSIVAYGQYVGMTFTANTVEGVEMTFSVTSTTDKTVQVGEGGYYSPAIDRSTTGSITIPATVSYGGVTYQVTSIGGSAFRGCSSLTSVGDLSSYTSIAYYAFEDCTSLTSVGDLSSCTSIGEQAFCGCTSLTSVGDLSSCTSIETNTFRGCSRLTTVGDLSSCTFIGTYAFLECFSLSSVGDISSCTSIGNSAFQDCYSLTSFTFPNSVTNIGNHAFDHCTGLTSITIPKSVTSIGEFAFFRCNSLTSVTVLVSQPLPITESTFSNHANATLYVPVGSKAAYEAADYWKDFNEIIDMGQSIAFEDAAVKAICVTNWDTNSDGELSYAEAAAVTDLGEVFQSNQTIISFDELRYFTSLESISNSAFGGCSGLTSITIGNSVTSIGDYAFVNCSSLSSITIPKSVVSIGDIAFDNCSGLSSITIPRSVVSIGYIAFRGCTGLYSINVEAGNTKYDSHDNSNAIIETESNTLITGCLNTIIPNNVTSIGESAFDGCTGLTSITIPNSVTSIGSYAFSGCSGLTSIELSNNVISIGSYAFSGCSGLTNITIPNSVTYIGSYAFKNSGWYDAQSDGTLYLDNWLICYKGNKPTGEITVKNGTKGLASSAFYGSYDLTSITIPNSVIFIGDGVFTGCSKLTSITIPNGVTSIGNRAFIGCSDLSSVISKIEEPFVFGSSAFFNISNNCVLKVPVGTRDAYIAAGWTEDVFKGGVVEMEASVTDISQMDNVIYIEPTEGREGDIVSLEVKLKNSITPVGCSFKLKLPEGFSLVKDSDGDVIYELSDRTKKMSVTMQDWNNGSYDFALTPSTGTATISGNDGTIVTLRIQVPEEVAPGDYKIKLTNNLIQSKVSGTTQDNALPDIKTTFTVEDYIMGDVNGDKIVTPADAIMILYHYFNVEQNGFIVKAADLNKDGNITPADAIEALYLYFGVGNSNAVRSFMETLDPQ